VIAFAYELFNFSLTIDEELYSGMIQSSDALGWVRQGRWGMYMLVFLFPVNSIIPFVPMLVTLLFSSLSFVVVSRLLSPVFTSRNYIAAPLFLACPTLYYAYQFNTLNYGLGITFFTGALSVYFFTNNTGTIRWVFGVMLMAFTIGVYQAFLPWVITLFSLYLLGEIINNEKVRLKSVGQFIAFMVISIISYLIISKLFQFALESPPDSYISGFSRWQLSIEYFMQVVRSIWHGMLIYYGGRTAVYYESIYFLSALFLISLSSILFLLFKSKQCFSVKVLGSFLLLFILFMPFSMNIVSGGALPVRAMLAIPLVLSGVIFLSLQISYKPIKLIIIILTISCSFQFFSINSRFAFSDQMNWLADRELSLRILEKMDELQVRLPLKQKSETWPVVLVGKHLWPVSAFMVNKETIGMSFYAWDGGNISRFITFIRTLGAHDYREARLNEQKKVMEKAAKMPIWPDAGSVAIVDNIIVVKLGNYTSPQLHAPCLKLPRSEVCRVQYHPLNDGIAIVKYTHPIKGKDTYYNYLEHIDKIIFNEVNVAQEPTGVLRLEPTSSQSMVFFPPVQFSPKHVVRLNIQIVASRQSSMRLFFLLNGTHGVASELHLSLTKGKNSFSLLIPDRLFSKSFLRIDPLPANITYTIYELTAIKEGLI